MRPARTEPGVAPAGGEALYVLVHTPFLRPHHDWDRLFPTYRKTILEKLSRTAALTDLEQHIRFEQRLTPADIHERFGVLNGAIYGIASHGRWLGAFKPSNRSPDVKGLYLAGGAAHPGPGMPMILMSGWIAADALDRDGVAGRTVHEKRPRGVVFGPLESAESNGRPHPARIGPPPDFLPPVMVRRSPWLVRFFTRHVKRFQLRRNFHAVRLSRTGRPAPVPDGPLIVVLNHPSWWDPLIGFVLTELFPDRAHYFPMDAHALQRYRIFQRLGAFGIELETRRGTREFLRTGRAILAQPRTALWITAQGRFADARERPVAIQPGVAHLARRLERAVILPLALEYPFWQARCPEALARFGPAIVLERGADRTVAQWRMCIEQSLAGAQDALAGEAQSREPDVFETLVGGKAAVGSVHDFRRPLLARVFGKGFRPEHGDLGVLPAPRGFP